MTMAEHSTENMEYVRRLLKRNQPDFFEALERAAELVDQELTALFRATRAPLGVDQRSAA